MPDYPLHEKLTENLHRQEPVDAFLQWLEGREESLAFGKVALCKWVMFENEPWAPKAEYYPLTDREKAVLIGEWLGIDYDAFMEEKEEMYQAIVRGLTQKGEEHG